MTTLTARIDPHAQQAGTLTASLYIPEHLVPVYRAELSALSPEMEEFWSMPTKEWEAKQTAKLGVKTAIVTTKTGSKVVPLEKAFEDYAASLARLPSDHQRWQFIGKISDEETKNKMIARMRQIQRR